MREIVKATGLCKRYGATEALVDVSFSLGGPQVIGILGPNGAGKTTLLDLLEGLAEPTRGELRLFGAGIDPYPRRRVGVVMQQEFGLDRITAREYAELFAAIFEVRGGAEKILRDAALEARATVPLERLSGGESQRLFIAASVVHAPELLFLDEPTAHLDPQSKEAIGDLIREMKSERTIVLTTHDLQEADALCDHVLFLVEGRIKAQGPRQELIEAVPAAARRGRGLEDAFFHFCSLRIREGRAVREPG